MVYTFTNKQEIAGPLAALYLLRGSCSYASANCAKLPLSDILIQLQATGEYRCSLVHTQATGTFTSASFLDDYIYRPRGLTNTSLYEFSMRCYRRSTTTPIPDNKRFNDFHPLSASHCVAFRRVETVPLIQGPRLPKLTDDSSDEVHEVHARIALVLFKPFRVIGDLVGNCTTLRPWTTAYNAWKDSRSGFTRTIMNNMYDFHAGRVSAEEDAVLHATAEPEEASCSESDASDDGYDSDMCLIEPDGVEMPDCFNAFEDLEANCIQGLQSFPVPASFPARVQSLLKDFQNHRLLERMTDGMGLLHDDIGHFLRPDDLRKWVQSAASEQPTTLCSPAT
jgi:hypothetical protein